MPEQETPESTAAGRLGRIFALVPAVLILLSLASPPAAAYARHHHSSRFGQNVNLVDPTKDAALVIDGATGKVLYERDADAVRHPASLTKMMTLYLLFEQLKNGQMTLATPLPVSYHAAEQHRTKLYLRPGSTITVESAIRAIVVCSANDVAVTIAEAIGGTESHFAEMMNAKAREFGMTHTYYHNATGLPDDLQVTTASDLAILARHLAYDFPQYFPYFSTETFTWHGETHRSTDHLLGAYQGADGIKTGYTQASGFNLVSSVVRGGAHVIAVVMGGRTAHRRDTAMIRLLDKTFAEISRTPELVARIGVPWQTIAQNTQSTPAIAGFQIAAAGSPPHSAAPPDQTAKDLRVEPAGDSDDEAAAESRIDPDETPLVPEPPQQHPPIVANELPQPTATAHVAALPQQQPVRVTPAARPYAAPDAVVTPTPRPQSTVVLAAYRPQPAVPAAPKSNSTPVQNAGATGLGVNQAMQSTTNIHNWAVQIGAFADEASANAELSAYAERSMDVLGQASRIVVPFQSADGHTLYRARFGPFAEREAREVCERLTERGQTCFAAMAER